MKRELTAIFTALVFWIAMSYIGNAQEGKAVDPAGKVQGMIAADSDHYIIGPEDVLSIYVWKEEAFNRTLPVRIDGKISLPLLDDIQAAGLTPFQLKEALAKKLKDFVEDPTVTITVMEANSYKAYISGEVKTPGVYRLHKELTLIKLIIMAGGFTEWANQKKILIITKEKGEEKRIIANYKTIIEGEEPDIVIKRGDIVIVK
jgi:polysaccharide export outer membrane protein